MYKITSIVLKLAILTFIFNANANTEYYEYDFIDKKNSSTVTIRLNAKNVDKYPGWKHSRNGTAYTSLWYPSLTDASSPNVWMSTRKEQNKAKIKPNNNDRKLNLALGNMGPNTIVDPDEISLKNTISECKTKQSFEDFTKEGTTGLFDHYKNIKRSTTSQEKHLYIPTNSVKGIGCVVCNGATCQVFGVSNAGIQYVATEPYTDSKMLDEVLDIHNGVNQFIESKLIKN